MNLTRLTKQCEFIFFFFMTEFKKCCNGASHESLSKKGIARYEQAISYNIIYDGNNDQVTELSHLLGGYTKNSST